MTRPTTDGVCLAMRRLSLMLVLVGMLAGCSSGSGDVAEGSGGDATKFCDAIKKLESAKSSPDVAAAGANLSSAATDLQAYAPSEIKAATVIYAEMIDTVGKSAKSGSMDHANPAEGAVQRHGYQCRRHRQGRNLGQQELPPEVTRLCRRALWSGALLSARFSRQAPPVFSTDAR